MERKETIKKKLSRREKAKMKAIAGIVLAVIGAIIVVIAAAYGVSRIISNKASKIVEEKMAAEEAAKAEELEKEAELAAVEEPEEETPEPVVEEVKPVEVAEPESTEEEAAVEEEPAVEMIITTDKVKIRSMPSTESDVLDLADKGEKFVRIEETEDGWSKIEYKDSEGYIKSDYVKVYTEEDAEETEEAPTDEEAQEAVNKALEDAAAAQAQIEASQQPSDQSQNQTETPAPAPAPTPAPAPAAGGAHVVQTSDGATMTVNDAQYAVFQKYWGYLGNVDETVSHHTKGDLITLLTNEGVY